MLQKYFYKEHEMTLSTSRYTKLTNHASIYNINNSTTHEQTSSSFLRAEESITKYIMKISSKY